jgi:hypothetical protein
MSSELSALEDFWVITQTSGAPVELMSTEGDLQRAVMMRIHAENAGTDDTSDLAYVLDLDDVARLISGLMEMAQHVWGPKALQVAMAEVLNIPAQLRDDTIQAVNDAMDDIEGRQ